MELWREGGDEVGLFKLRSQDVKHLIPARGGARTSTHQATSSQLSANIEHVLRLFSLQMSRQLAKIRGNFCTWTMPYCTSRELRKKKEKPFWHIAYCLVFVACHPGARGLISFSQTLRISGWNTRREKTIPISRAKKLCIGANRSSQPPSHFAKLRFTNHDVFWHEREENKKASQKRVESRKQPRTWFFFSDLWAQPAIHPAYITFGAFAWV